MRMIQVFLFAVLITGAANSAMALPHLLYNPSSGNITWVHDGAWFPGSLPAAILKSAGLHLTTNSSAALPIPGAVLDTGDLPFAVTYLNLPLGQFDGGNIVTPGTPVADLSLQWYASLGSLNIGDVILVPEPAAAVSGGLLGVFGMRRRRMQLGML